MHACVVLTLNFFLLLCTEVSSTVLLLLCVLNTIFIVKVLYSIDAAATLIHCRQYVTKYVDCQSFYDNINI